MKKYGDVVQIEAKGQVVNALVARSVEIAPHNPANGQPLKDIEGNQLASEEHVDLVYLDPEAENQKGGPTLKVREKRFVAVKTLVGEQASESEPEPESESLPSEPEQEGGTSGAMAAVAMFLIALLFGASAAWSQSSQQGVPPVRLYYATDYAVSNLLGQNPNTYTWNLGQAPTPGSCAVTPANGAPAFFLFGPTATPYPEFIRDSNPALSEVFTPTSTSVTGSTCGFAGSPVNNHVTFWVSSGTAGLYEAVGSNSTQGSVTNVLLDKWWYAALAGLPGPQNPLTVIQSTAIAGSTHVNIIDTTTAPWTTYSWNGTQYTANGVSTGFPTLGVSSYTNIAAPTALTTVAATCATNGGGCITTATTGGTIPASGAYTLGATCVDASGGETTLSVDTAAGATVTVGSTATNIISVSSPAGCTAALGAVGWRLYVTAASGASLSEILYTPTCSTGTLTQPYLQPTLTPVTVCPVGATATISAIITGTATIPLVSGAWPRIGGSSNSWPAFTAGGALATTVVGEMGHVAFPAAYWNKLGRKVEFKGNGYATVNGTTGTLTLSANFTSIYGVTQITPFTAVSGTTTASAQIPIDFDVTFETSKIGATGTLEVHGCVNYGLAGTAPATGACDIIFAASSTVDLTKQNTLVWNIKPTTTATTAYQLRQLTAIAY
jgi:hypothetical protein